MKYENIILSNSLLNNKNIYLEQKTLRVLRILEKQTKKYGFVLNRNKEIFLFKGKPIKVGYADIKRFFNGKCSLNLRVVLNHHFGIRKHYRKKSRTIQNVERTKINKRRILNNVSYGNSIFKVTSKFHKTEKEFRLSPKKDKITKIVNGYKISNLESLNRIKDFEIKRLF